MYFGYFIAVLCAGALVYIFIDRIRDKTPAGKLFSIIKMIGIIAGYIVLIWMIRTNEVLVAYREKYGCKHVLLGAFGAFLLSLLITGILNPMNAKPGSKRAKAAGVMESVVWCSRIALILAVPIILALEIE